MDDKIIQNAFQEIRDFFKLPEEEKKAVHFHKSSFFRGYEDYLLQGTRVAVKEVNCVVFQLP